MTTSEELKSIFVSGATATQQMFHDLIDYIDQVKLEAKAEVTIEIMAAIAKQHEVSEVSTFATANGTDIHWLNYGKTYSIWTSQVVENEFVIPAAVHKLHRL